MLQRGQSDFSGESIEVPLDRISANVFAAEVPADEQGVYAVGSSLTDANGQAAVSGTALAARSYSPEYRPGEPDRAALERVAALAGGRIDTEPIAAFDTDTLTQGKSWFSLVPWLLLLAALAWPIAVALSRIAIRRGAAFASVDERAGQHAADRNAALRVSRARQPDPDPATADGATADPVTPVPVTPVPQRPSAGDLPVPTKVQPAANHEPSATDAGDGSDKDSGGGSTSTLDALLARKRRAADD